MRKPCTRDILFDLLLALFISAFAAAPVSLAAEEAPPAGRNTAAPGVAKGADSAGGSAMEGGETLSLDRCIEIALRKNPTIVAAANTMEASRSRVGQARAGYYPQLNWSSNYSRVNPVPATSAALPGTRQRYDEYSSSVTLSQTLLDFGKTSSFVDIQKSNLESARSDLDSTTDQIIFNVKQAYYGLLQARRNRNAAQDIVKQLQLHLEQAKGFYEVGVRAKIDVTKAGVDLSNGKLNLIRAENAIKIAKVTLNNAMGAPDAAPFAVEDNLAFQKFEITFDEALKRAYESRPDLKSVIAKRQAAEASLSFARSGYAPVLSGNASYNRGGQDFPLEDGWNIGVTLTIPLFSGFLTSHQVSEAKSTLYVLKANEESLRQQVLLEIQQAFLSLQEAQDSIATAELTVQQAQENLDLANGRYAAGVGSPVEVTDAFTSYANAQVSYTGALYNYKIAQASIEKEMGVR